MVEVKSRYLQAAVIVHLFSTVTTNVCIEGRIHRENHADPILAKITLHPVLLPPFKGFCFDEEGKKYKNHDTWKISPCLKCNCTESQIHCQRDLKVFVAGYRNRILLSKETCSQSSCNVTRFVKLRKDVCGTNCRDEEGLGYKSDQAWWTSPCLHCHCKENLISCQRRVRVVFPGHRNSFTWLEETCHQPACNILQFIRERTDICEGAEMTRDGGILMKHQSWNYKGCKLFFNGTDLDGREVCPPMARPECYVYSGTICCASKCAALQEIANMLRGHLSVCSNGHQLVSDGLCQKKTPGCLRDPSRNSCSSVVSCQDEKSNQYFEGVTWSVGNCIQCSCRAGKIHCKREISVINSLEEESLTEYCIQNECDVSRFLAKNRGKCKACRWNGTIYFDGDSWKENDIHFFCSTYNQTLRAGCYVEQRRVNCVHTSKSDIGNITSLYDDLFLCKSGDEILSMDNRCDGSVNDCSDGSDEDDCDQCYCASKNMMSYKLPRSAYSAKEIRRCSAMDPSLTGTLQFECVYGTYTTMWRLLYETCKCENKGLLDYFNQKIKEVNITNFLGISRELSASIGRFQNSRVFFETYNNLVQAVKTLLTPITSKNANITMIFCQDILVADEHAPPTSTSDFCKTKSSFNLEERIDLKIAVCHLFREAAPLAGSNNTCDEPPKMAEITSRIFSQSPPRKMTFTTEGYNRLKQETKHQLDIRLSVKSLGWRPEFSPKEVPLNLTSVVNTTSSSNILEKVKVPSSHKEKEIMEANGCKLITIDGQNGDEVMLNPELTPESLKQREIQDNLELVLTCTSIGAVFVSLVLLTIIRIKSEKLFVHKNLLLSMGLGNLVGVLDVTFFKTREKYPAFCTTLAVVEHFLYTAIFTWMLVEGINLYIKLVKVFSLNKQYVTYVAVGWGIPLVIVSLVAAIEPSSYDMGKVTFTDITCGSLVIRMGIKRDRCWLNGNQWIFKGPVLAILLANVVIFAILLRVVFGKLASKYSKNSLEASKKGLKSILALLPLLGVTYLFGFIQFNEALRYLFIVLNSTQGVVFSVFHCILDDQVREAIRKLCKKQSLGSQTETSIAMTSDGRMRTGRKSQGDEKKDCEVVVDERVKEEAI